MKSYHSKTYVDENGNDLLWEDNIMDAVKLWFIYGISAGSFTTALLQDDIESARLRAHPNIKDYVDGIYKCICNILPYHCTGDQIDSWNGYKNASDKVKEEIMIQTIAKPYLKVWIKECES